ncbi:maltokinase N-terminal cap-like domain-containing protein [Nocardia sp. BMG111209]|uniref:maltokinase N-terminal cap-like domain-containing protein n=1 Tax=Nocardia sp. BMG111209 TaxID=1160137 RepID=UPI00039A23E7|nr:hypothetical protein [Nocardia sp. BMG111209]
MATVHRTTLEPSKLDLLTRWLPTRSWYAGGPQPSLTKAGGFRIDDPAGAVGIEFMVVTDTAAADPIAYLVPMTYRAEPLPGADDALIGTSEHGVLGTRWFYDATRDPVFVTETVRLATGATVAQDQNTSDTADPSVTVSPAEYPADPRADSVTDTDRDTVLGLGAGQLVVHRILTATTGSTPGQVCAPWRVPAGGLASGVFVQLTTH